MHWNLEFEIWIKAKMTRSRSQLLTLKILLNSSLLAKNTLTMNKSDSQQITVFIHPNPTTTRPQTQINYHAEVEILAPKSVWRSSELHLFRKCNFGPEFYFESGPKLHQQSKSNTILDQNLDPHIESTLGGLSNLVNSNRKSSLSTVYSQIQSKN